MKILWLCNSLFSIENKKSSTGTWLQPLAFLLQKSGEVQIVNVSFNSASEKTQKENIDGITQYAISSSKTFDYGQTFSNETKKRVRSIIESEQPDLIHIWGTEAPWVSVFDNCKFDIPILLDIQGLMYAYVDYFYGGLSLSEILQSIHLKEILKPSRTLFIKKRVFKKRGEFEVKYIKQIKHISYQSQWVKEKLMLLSPDSKLYSTNIILRDEFYSAIPWSYKEPLIPTIFSTCSSAVTYKGMHMLIKSLSEVKKVYPNVVLRIAGNMNVGNKLLDGYSIFLNNLIKKYSLEDNIIFLGSITSSQIVHELQNSNVCVIPSFIETYCLAFAEAMMVGTPTVVSYAGAMPGLANDGAEALFYNSQDYRQCASNIIRLLKSETLSSSISKQARAKRLLENDKNIMLRTQLRIYSDILSQ